MYLGLIPIVSTYGPYLPMVYTYLWSLPIYGPYLPMVSSCSPYLPMVYIYLWSLPTYGPYLPMVDTYLWWLPIYDSYLPMVYTYLLSIPTYGLLQPRVGQEAGEAEIFLGHRRRSCQGHLRQTNAKTRPKFWNENKFLFLWYLPKPGLFVYFRPFLQTKTDIVQTLTLKVCLGFKPGIAKC